MEYTYINSNDDVKIKNLFDLIKDDSTKLISLDTEDSGLDFLNDTTILLQLKMHDEIYLINCINVSKKLIEKILERIITSNKKVILHNAKFDIKFLYTLTGLLITNVHDTLTTETLLNSGIGKTLYSLKELIYKYCNVVIEKEIRNEFIGNTSGILTDEQLEYSAKDVEYLEYIYNRQMSRIEETNEGKVYDLEMNDISVVAMMEYKGIILSVERWTELYKEAEKLKEQFRNEITSEILDKVIKKTKPDTALTFADLLGIREGVKSKRARNALSLITDSSLVLDWAKKNFNMSSSQQLVKTLNLIGVNILSTNEKVMNKVESKYPIISTILKFREYEKQVSTYGENVIKLINPTTGRIHTDYFNIGTKTGRVSSRNPNLQNIPRTTDYRRCFVSEDGFSLVGMDYSQQEYRFSGAVSGEPKIIQAYCSGKDMHQATAAIILNKSIDDITKDERNFGKTFNFAVLYGTTKFGLQKNLNVPMEVAEGFLQTFEEGYPVLMAFKDLAEKQIWKLGYSITKLGRRRYNIEKPDMMDSNEFIRFKSRVLREGFNHIVQGSCADITKMAIYNLFSENPFGDKFRILLQVHDEVVMEIHDSILESAIEFGKEMMLKAEQPYLGEIPAAVDVKVGKEWIKG